MDLKHTTPNRVHYTTILNKRRRSSSKTKVPPNFSKRYLKFLAVCQDPKLVSSAVRAAPDRVIKRICDAALNAANGDIPLTSQQKQLFARNKKLFQSLIDTKVPIVRKRRQLSNQRGAGILPILLSTVLGTLGSLLFKPKE